mmetsp:Transcript_28957/g.57808  ORF Transcript_28957/g.57808 Transcript_28957/m.57808 type:complete len:584 (+) Transcript_28957:77-1828(+)
MSQHILPLISLILLIIISPWLTKATIAFGVVDCSSSSLLIPFRPRPCSRGDCSLALKPKLPGHLATVTSHLCRKSSSRLNDSIYTRDEDSSAPPSLRVGIVGAGSIAFGTSSLLSSMGHDPMVWSPSGRGTQELVKGASRGQQQNNGPNMHYEIQSSGALEQKFHVRVASTARELVRSNDNILVIALPVNGHKMVMEKLAPEIIKWKLEQKSGNAELTHIIISSHASLGAVFFMQLLREERRKYLEQRPIDTAIDLGEGDYEEVDIGIRITAWGTTAVTARKISENSVNVLTIRKSVDFCTVPSDPNELEAAGELKELSHKRSDLLRDGYQLCTTLFGKRFQYRRGGLLAISLSNLNPQNHLGIVLGNMSRMDPPPPPPPFSSCFDQPKPEISSEPWYQGRNITPNIGRLMEALDRERIEIANALDIEVRTIYQHFSWSFHVPMETPITDDDDDPSGPSLASDKGSAVKMRPTTVSEMNQQMHYYAKTDVLGPAVANSRYVLEDVPYGLVLTVILGKLVKRPAVLHESGIRIISAMYGRDFITENNLLEGLGLIDNGERKVDSELLFNLDKWREMAYSGYFKD